MHFAPRHAQRALKPRGTAGGVDDHIKRFGKVLISSGQHVHFVGAKLARQFAELGIPHYRRHHEVVAHRGEAGDDQHAETPWPQHGDAFARLRRNHRDGVQRSSQGFHQHRVTIGNAIRHRQAGIDWRQNPRPETTGQRIDAERDPIRTVRRQTGGKQEPWTQASLSGDFYFNAPVAAASSAAPFATPAASAAAPAFDPRALELAFWESIKDSERASDFEAYLAQYPTGVFAALAASRVVALKESQVASLPPAATVAPPAPALSVVDLDDSYVTVKTANLRAEPSTDAAKAGTLPPDTLVQATGKLADGSWVRVAHAGGAAWVWGPLVEPVDAGEHAAWSRASGGDASAVEGFLKAHPRGRYAVAAEARLAALRAPTPPAPPATPVVGTFPQTASRRPGEVFRDCGECPEMVVIPAGEFMMGSPDSEPGRDADEGPLRRVRIGYPLAVGKFEVTFAEWDACVSAGGCNHRPNDGGWGRGSRPVVDVNWGDAQAYVKWLSRTTGQRYRLLSESEWEYAARAGTTTPFHTGSRITTAQANFSGNQTVPVGRFGANLFGLHDMHGNVWEWVEDCWNRSYAGAPSDGSAWRSGECSRRVLRGGSWGNNPTDLRSAFRGRVGTGDRGNNGGFRVARTL